MQLIAPLREVKAQVPKVRAVLIFLKKSFSGKARCTPSHLLFMTSWIDKKVLECGKVLNSICHFGLLPTNEKTICMSGMTKVRAASSRVCGGEFLIRFIVNA